MALCSIGIAAGIIGLVALVKRAFFHRRFGHGGGGCGSRGHGHWRGHWRGRHGGGPGGSWWLRALFSRLDTTPGQEREIRAAIEEVQSVAREAKQGVFGSRENIAKAVGGEVFDPSAIDDASAQLDAATARVKEAFRASLEKVHAVLDPKQRERLAELLQKGVGRGGYGWGGPYRA
jgi:Spy/CpxP family protein refolding chaperone